MGAVLNQPFISEAYDRLMEAQAAYRPFAVEDGVALRDARGTLGLSQTAFGALLGLDAPAISKLENGGTLDKRTDLAVRYLLQAHAK